MSAPFFVLIHIITKILCITSEKDFVDNAADHLQAGQPYRVLDSFNDKPRKLSLSGASVFLSGGFVLEMLK